MRNSILICAVAACVASPAFAKDDCTDAKDFVRVINAFSSADAERTNIIKPKFSLKLKGIGDNPDPDGMLYRKGDETKIFTVDSDGALMGLEDATLDKDGELCKLVAGEVAKDTGDDTVSANMSFSFLYHQSAGDIPMVDIKEGLKDGSKIMKSIAPGGLGFVVPSLKTLVVLSEGESGIVPSLILKRDGQIIETPEPLVQPTAHFYPIKVLEKTKADSLSLDGPGKLMATFKVDEDDFAKTADVDEALAE